MIKKVILWLILLVAGTLESQGQTYRYFLRFTDKLNSPYSLQQPEAYLSERSVQRRGRQGIAISENDLPPNPAYLTGITQAGAKVIYKSRWLNGALIEATEPVKNQLLSLSYVAQIEFNSPLKQVRKAASKDKFSVESTTSLNYGDATAQIHLLGVDSMHNAGFHGENMLIAILDDGFFQANQISCLDSAFLNNRIQELYDFVDNDSTVFGQGGHGTNVMSCMTGYVPDQLISPAFRSNFVLFRTEDGASETRAEEAYWLFAAERADSLGVDIINSSLGYSQFDNPADNYTPADMDGNTTLVTRAADLAASKGILVVNSAGNSGNTSWHIITAPADGDSVLAVGAVNRLGEIANFSSRGPAADGAVKPDVMAVGYETALCNEYGSLGISYGTSFSSPLTAAMAAGLWQANPHLQMAEVLYCLRKSGHIFANPNNNYGYGYANWVRADSVAKAEFSIRALQKSNGIEAISISPSTPALLTLKVDNTLLNKTLRISFTDLSNHLSLQQDSVNTTTEQIDIPLTFNTLQSNVLLRIENLTDARTVVLFRF